MEDTQADNAKGTSTGINVAPGSLFFELCLDSGISNHETRRLLRKKFGEEVLRLTGGKLSMGELATYLAQDLPASQTVPPSAAEMLAKLNEKGGYLEKIVAKCGSPTSVPLKDFMAKAMQGTDSYCIAPDGTVRCYHFFTLVPKSGSGGPLKVEQDNEIGLLAICCAGQSGS